MAWVHHKVEYFWMSQMLIRFVTKIYMMTLIDTFSCMCSVIHETTANTTIFNQRS